MIIVSAFILAGLDVVLVKVYERKFGNDEHPWLEKELLKLILLYQILILGGAKINFYTNK